MKFNTNCDTLLKNFRENKIADYKTFVSYRRELVVNKQQNSS